MYNSAQIFRVFSELVGHSPHSIISLRSFGNCLPCGTQLQRQQVANYRTSQQSCSFPHHFATLHIPHGRHGPRFHTACATTVLVTSVTSGTAISAALRKAWKASSQQSARRWGSGSSPASQQMPTWRQGLPRMTWTLTVLPTLPVEKLVVFSLFSMRKQIKPK